MANAPGLRISTIAAKQQHPKWSHSGCPLGRGLPTPFQPNPLEACTLGGSKAHIHSLAVAQLLANNTLWDFSLKEKSAFSQTGI